MCTRILKKYLGTKQAHYSIKRKSLQGRVDMNRYLHGPIVHLNRGKGLKEGKDRMTDRPCMSTR